MNVNFKKCLNGHYYAVSLDSCPYCGMKEKVDLSAGWEYNDNIDVECKELFPTFCTLGGAYPDVSHEAIKNRLHILRDRAIKERYLENTEWYGLMQLYIDEYTMKIIERKHCYKYALPELDENIDNLMIHHKFWILKKAIIKQDYGLDWQTPDEVFRQVRKEYLMRT